MNQNRIFDHSYDNLRDDDSPERKLGSKVILPKIQTPHRGQNLTTSSPKKIKSSKKKILPGYKLATLDTTMQFLDTQSYRKKLMDSDGQPYYEEYGACDEITSIKQYGLGIYLYLQLIKRLMITFIALSIIVGLPLAYIFADTGLSSYAQSFTIILAKFTIGNLSNANRLTYLVITGCDILTMIVLFIFYVHWRVFISQTLQEAERDHKIINPNIYALSVTGFDKQTPNLQSNLKAHVDGLYRGAYEVEIVYDYNRNFGKFVSYDEAIEAVEKEKQVIKQTEKDYDDLQSYEHELQDLEKQIREISDEFQPMYAIIHFRNLKAKYAFITTCKKYCLVNSFSYKLRRCFCCVPQLPQRQKFLNKDELIIESNDLARPQEFNWPNLDISTCSRVLRMLLSIIFLIVVIAVTSSLIVFCTLYVSTTSSCLNYNSSTTLEQAISSDDQTLFCFCNDNFAQIYIQTSIQNACSTVEQEILISNLLQVGASLASAITNVILIIIVTLIAEYLLKPETKPKQYSFIFMGVLLSNYINSTLLPLILNGNIFGFKSSTYLEWATFIDFNRLSIFTDFDRDWFAVISPYYTNFFLISAILPILQLFLFYIKRCLVTCWVRRKCENTNPHKITIQKEANSTIVLFPFDYPAEQALIALQLFMCFMYSSLIPLLIPIFTIGLFISFFCKRYILLHLSVRIPANEKLALSFMNMIPFVILIHGLMGVWSHTAPGFFDPSVYVVSLNITVDSAILTRALTDLLMLGATALILIWIILDWLIIGLISGCRQCCKDTLELPVSLAAVENSNFGERIRKVNLLGSYKVGNHPAYGHAINAFKELMKMQKLENNQNIDE